MTTRCWNGLTAKIQKWWLIDMKLFYSPTSPYVRKVVAAAIELGLDDKLQHIPFSPHPTRYNAELTAGNPLGKVPALLLESGEAIYPSSLICEYLDGLDGQKRLFPAQGLARRQALLEQALGDGLLDAALLARYELGRPVALQWSEWIQGQIRKIEDALDELERRVDTLEGRVDIGTLTLACALGYLDLRYAELAWRVRCPKAAAWYAGFSQRESMLRTEPQT